MKKYELIEKVTGDLPGCEGRVFYRIKALIDFGTGFDRVKKGDLGGLIESESNLSQEGDSWVFYDSIVCERGLVCDNAIVRGYGVVKDSARVYGNARICNSVVEDEARVYGNAGVSGFSHITSRSHVYGNAKISDRASVSGDAQIFDDAFVCDDAIVCENAKVFDRARIYDHAVVSGNAQVYGNAVIHDRAKIYGNAHVYDNANVYGNPYICGDAKIKTAFDYSVFQKTWSSVRYSTYSDNCFTYTASNKMWTELCFHGTGAELIAKAYKEGLLNGKCCEKIVRAVEAIEKEKDATK